MKYFGVLVYVSQFAFSLFRDPVVLASGIAVGVSLSACLGEFSFSVDVRPNDLSERED